MKAWWKPEDPPPDPTWLGQEEVKRKIRELQELQIESPETADLIYHRINELLDLLDSQD